MVTLRILVPDPTTNYVKNPSARFDTTGWSAVGSTLTRALDFARFGVASFKVVTNGSALREGIYYRVNALSGISEPITVSSYLLGAGRVRIRLIANPNGKEYIGQWVTLRADRWTRVHVSGHSIGSNDLRLYVETDGTVQAVTFYVDGAQMERKAYPTTFCDGDQEGCRWNVMEHNSVSIRDGVSRAGGRWVELAGEEQIEKNLYMTTAGGLGFAPIVNNLQSYADAPGSYYQNTKILARPMTFTFHAKHEHRTNKCSDTTLAFLHSLRQMLIDLIKPDRTRGGEEFLMEYQDGDTPLYIKTRYDGGLEGDWDVRNSWVTSFPVRLLAVSPFWYEDNQRVSALDFQEWEDANFIMTRDGVWGNMNYGFNNTVNDLAFGSRGEVIAVGAFTRANSNALAIDPLIPANRIAYWDGTQWNQYSTGANGDIHAVAVAPNGYVYVTGAFTSIGGVAANRVAYWNGSAWNAMGTGLNGTGRGIAIDPSGDVYVGGEFTTAGTAAAQKIAHWDGANWQTIGTYGGLNGTVHSIAISPDGITVYAGGEFTDEYTLSASALLRVAQYDTVTGLFDNLGGGFGSTVYEVGLSPSGTLYAGGAFTISGSQTINGIAYYNGATWLALGAGANGTVYGFDILSNGELIIVGDFDEAGGVDSTGVAIWNGSSWSNMDIVQENVIYAVLYDEDKNIYLGADSPIHTAGVTTVTNSGTTETNPKLYISGPATLKFIENQTAQKRVYMDLDILSGEDVFFDFGRGKIFSTVRGDLSYSILPGSDMRAFTLLPGENKIAALMVEDIAAKLYMSYVPRHWSVDATARGEEF